MPPPPLERNKSFKRRYISSSTESPDRTPTKENDNDSWLQDEHFQHSPSLALHLSAEVPPVTGESNLSAPPAGENDSNMISKTPHHKSSHNATSTKRQTSLSTKIATIREQNEILAARMQDIGSDDPAIPSNNPPHSRYPADSDESLYRKIRKKTGDGSFPRTYNRKIHSSQQTVQNRHKMFVAGKKNGAASSSSPSIVVGVSSLRPTDNHGASPGAAPHRRRSHQHISPSRRAWMQSHTTPPKNTLHAHSPSVQDASPSSKRSPKLSPLMQMYADYSSPQWNSHIAENTLTEINDKILMFERELNRLYQKKKRILSPQQKRNHSLKHRGVLSDPSTSDIPLEQRLKKLYNVLPASSKKVFRQTISSHIAPTKKEKVRKVIVHDEDVNLIVLCQSIMRMLFEFHIFEKEMSLWKQMALERPAVEADHLSTGDSGHGEDDNHNVINQEATSSAARMHVPLTEASHEEDQKDNAPRESHDVYEHLSKDVEDEEKEESLTAHGLKVSITHSQEQGSPAHDHIGKPQAPSPPFVESIQESTTNDGETRTKSASLIQRIFRRHQTNKFVLYNHSARRIQRKWKRYLFLKEIYAQEDGE